VLLVYVTALVIVAALIGINLLGVIGAILAVLIAAGAQVLVSRVAAPAIHRAWNRSEPGAGRADMPVPAPVPAPEPGGAEP
jgi:hypothetical protein